MAIDYRIGNKVIKNLRREDTAATRVDPYPYIGVIKNNLDPTRSGRLQVYIPDLGGQPDEPTNWRTVSYASPFMGYTPQKQQESDIPSDANAFDQVPHTYGMWMVPPDIGVQVLVIFVAGDPNRGFWLACVNPNLSHHMLPGLAGSVNVERSGITEYERKLRANGLPLPVTEYNEYDPKLKTSAFYNNPKPVHKPQLDILQQQGLDRDPVRGSISSSSQRETPSQVFGISTPGRPSNNAGSKDPAKDPNYIANAEAGKLDESYYQVKSRKGGHTFVMDDGDVTGNDQLIRLRTASGHQIMMHDTAETLYISNANGNSWVELTKTGSVNVYGKNGIALRSEGPINIHSDSNIVMNAGNNITLRAGNRINMESTSTNILSNRFSLEATNKIEFKTGAFNVAAERNISLGADQKIILKSGSGISQDSDPAAPVTAVTPVRLIRLPDTTYDKTLGVWKNGPSALETAVTVAPSHEPFYRGAPVPQPDPEAAKRELPAKFTGTTDAVKDTTGVALFLPITTDPPLRNQPAAKTTVGNLSKDQMTALLAQIGNSESGGKYTEDGKGNSFVGKYQFGYEALQQQGYVKSSVTSNSQLNNPNSWTGKEGIVSKSAWLNNGPVQEEAMEELLRLNYKRMAGSGAITQDMPPEEVGGMLMTAHLLGGGGANSWRRSGNDLATRTGQDANNISGSRYFVTGKYAISQLAPKLPGINAG